MNLPKLRELEVFPVAISGRRMIGLRDPMNFSSEIIAVPHHMYLMLSLFDGQHSIVDIQTEYMRAGGELIYRETIEDPVIAGSEWLYDVAAFVAADVHVDPKHIGPH